MKPEIIIKKKPQLNQIIDCFPAFLRIPTPIFKLIIDSIVWAFKHTMRDIAETGTFPSLFLFFLLLFFQFSIKKKKKKKKKKKNI